MSGDARLLDTNAMIALIGGDSALIACLTTSSVYTSTIVLGELCFGAEKSARVAANLKQIDAYAAGMTVLAVSVDVAKVYARIRNELRVAGRPIPENDIWIAATARFYGLILMTRDAHFGNVHGLSVEAW